MSKEAMRERVKRMLKKHGLSGVNKPKKKRASFKSRHAKNIKKGKMSAAYWADKTKW